MANDLGFVHRFEAGDDPTTLVLLHGTGGDENDLIPVGRALAPGASLLSPRGPVLESGMPRFFRRLAMGIFDVEDLKQRTADLARFLSSASETYRFSLERAVLVGYSNGANIGASLLLMEPGLVRGAALLHAMVPFDPDEIPDLRSTSALITGGERDPMIPQARTRALATLLEEAGADVRLEIMAGGHELTMPEIEIAGDWLRQSAPARSGPV